LHNDTYIGDEIKIHNGEPAKKSQVSPLTQKECPTKHHWCSGVRRIF